MEIKHSVHPHPMFLRENNKSKGFCFICEASIFGYPFYVCEDCKFHVHKWCVELPPVIDHPFHPQHPLKLNYGNGFYCNSCHKKFEEKPSFRCNKCDFDLDIECALMPKINPEGEEFIQHFSHQHPLILCSEVPHKFIVCFACKSNANEVLYGCIPCEYFLHKSCSELPSLVLHILHPQHLLHLQVMYGECQICKDKNYTFKFRCDDCSFSLDVSCWMRYTRKEKGRNLEIDCFICSKQHLDSFSCIDSKYLLSQTSISLPKEITHQFHPHEPLQILAPKDFGCNSCHKWFNKKSCYGCPDSNFHMDVKCALMPMVQQNEGVKYPSQSIPFHFSHQHPLCLITVEFGIICSVCQMTCPSPIYGCLQCEYFLHQSCIELPSEIESRLHGQHKLTVKLVHNEYCQLCLKRYSGFFFGCVECAFYIGIECRSLNPKFNIRYAYHEHPMCLVENSYCEKCDSNESFCAITKLSRESKLSQAYLLRCVQCNYNVHLPCSQLPCTIEDKNHLHSLTLTEYVVEDDCDDYYCDICEEERDPRLCVYWCKDCDFASHVHCVMSEILNSWKKDPRHVELRFARDLNLVEMNYQSSGSEKVWKFKNVLDSLTKHQRKEIEACFPTAKLYGEYADYRKIEDEGRPTSTYQGKDIIQELSLHNAFEFLGICEERLKRFREHEDYRKIEDEGRPTSKYEGKEIIQELSLNNAFDISDILKERLERFELGRKYHIQPYEYELKVVEVGDYNITSNFASLLSALIMKHCDFSARTRFNKNFKCVIFYIVCRMVDDMLRTCLADLTERQLITWGYYYKGAHKLGFNLKFVYPILTRAFTSFTELQAMKVIEELPNKVALEIAGHERKISEIKSQIERWKIYLLQFEPDKYLRTSYAWNHKWRRIGKDII